MMDDDFERILHTKDDTMLASGEVLERIGRSIEKAQYENQIEYK